MIDKYELQRLRDLPIEGVAERLGLHVSRHVCLCPFHDDHHASLSFCSRRNTWRCWACGAQGGTIDLVMRRLALPFPDACRWLADATGAIITEENRENQFSTLNSQLSTFNSQLSTFDAARYAPLFEHPQLSLTACHFLFEERRIDPRVVSWCRLASWRDRQGHDWLQIPYYDREGRLTGIQSRNLTPGALPRFRFPAGAVCTIYNLPVLALLKPHEPLFITEGCSDCWAMLSAGHKAIAIPSATLLKPRDIQTLLTINSQLSTPFHMYPDRDEPGERLFLQLHQMLPNLQHHQLPPSCKDFSDFFRQKAG